MDEGMSRGSPFDFPQANKVSTLEVACAVLELPKW